MNNTDSRPTTHDFEAELAANGGHTAECEGSCDPMCPIGIERRREANARAARAQHAWDQANASDMRNIHRIVR